MLLKPIFGMVGPLGVNHNCLTKVQKLLKKQALVDYRG